MDLCNELCSAGVLRGKTFNTEHYSQTLTIFTPAMLIVTIDFYHFIPLTLTLA